MKLKIIFAVLALCGIFGLHAQNEFRAQIIDHETGDPLFGVTVLIPELKMGGTTGESGEITIDGIPDGEFTMRFSYVGYQTLERSFRFPLVADQGRLVIELHATFEEMEQVTVTSTRSTRSIEDIPTRIEFIAGEELSEKGNMKPGDIRMLLNESTGIQTQQTSATSYNSSIRIQGLDGKYTQLLRDGMPLYSGFSGGLSLMQIAPLDLRQVEVIKGATSTLYGGGAIAGLVNLITKMPGEESELSFMLNGTSALGLDASGFFSGRNGKVGTTVFASYNLGTPYDPADIGLTAIPDFNRFTLNPRLFIYFNDQTTLNAGVNIISENRVGGNLEFAKGEAVADPYFEENKTERISTQMQLSSKMGDSKRLEFKNSLNFYDRSIAVPDYVFAGNQFSSFSELNFSWGDDQIEWISGLNLWTDQFRQSEGNPDEDLSYSNATLGGFLQNTWNLHSLWTLEAGFRLDYQNQYGWFPLPRFSLMFNPASTWTFRLGGGLGYKTPTVFSEEAERLQFWNIRPLDTEALSAERSVGANFDINHRMPLSPDLIMTSNLLFYYTQIRDPLQLTSINGFFEFTQPAGYVDTQGVEVNLKWSYRDLKLFVGYTYANVKEHYNGVTSEFPLVAKHRLNNVLMYEKHDNFWIGLEAYYFSPQQLNDGTTGKSYWITGVMTEKRIGEHLSVFLNFENFLDTRQTAFDTIFTGDLSDPQFRDIYAPVDGFVVNGGLKLNL
ncbi:TonB-dependent receptor [Robiginitalea sp. IMCC43444]|uniref:TonB-dependent receptor n=1 Tax=Robiginitalea sp. IMCC43444 TaxID=3459121 RepID=UPI004041D6AD